VCLRPGDWCFQRAEQVEAADRMCCVGWLIRSPEWAFLRHKYEGDAAAFQADVRDEDQVHALVAFAQATYGGRIDIVVNNANIPFAVQPFAETSWSAFTQTFRSDAKFVHTLTKIPQPPTVHPVRESTIRAKRPAFLAHEQNKEVFYMSVDVLSHDLVPRDEQYPPTLRALTFESHGKQLLGCMLVAQGVVIFTRIYGDLKSED
jgi:NAD(P)-dependent dehydrogenase (short-subunit alcohol dehydrogenase family)